MKTLFSVIVVSITILSFLSGVNYVRAEDKTMMNAPFGNPEDITYAKDLWTKLEKSRLNSTPATLYTGGPPHGKVREVLEGEINGNGKRVIVKRNYGGKDVSISTVKNNRSKYLKAITVMAKREKGYDPENSDWFWVKYKPNGELHKNKMGMLLAGRIGKGMTAGCIACHKSASGGDMVFAHNKEANADITIVK
jgi:hypothetical protein